MAAVPKNVHVGLNMWKPAVVCQHGALARTFWLKNHDLLQSHTAFVILRALHNGQGFGCALNKGQHMLVVALRKGLVGAMVWQSKVALLLLEDGDKPHRKRWG